MTITETKKEILLDPTVPMHDGEVCSCKWGDLNPLMRGYFHALLAALAVRYPTGYIRFGMLDPTCFRRSYYDCMGLLEILEEMHPDTKDRYIIDPSVGERFWTLRSESEFSESFGYLPLVPMLRSETIRLANAPTKKKEPKARKVKVHQCTCPECKATRRKAEYAASQERRLKEAALKHNLKLAARAAGAYQGGN